MKLRHTIAAATVAVVAALAPGAATLAHGDDGIIEVVTAQPAAPLTVTYEINLTYENDGDPALGATVTLAADGPDGTTLGPVPLQPTDQPGHYAATITYPSAGNWAVRLSALSPTAAGTRAETVAAAAPPTPPVPATPAPSAPTTSRASPSSSDAIAAPTTSSASAPTVAAPTTSVDADSNSSSSVPWIVGGIIVVVAAVAAATLIVRRAGR